MKKVDSLLVVDDDPEDIEFCRIILQRSGRYDLILTATTAKDALALFEAYDRSKETYRHRFPPRVILLGDIATDPSGSAFLEAFSPHRQAIEEQGLEPPAVLLLSSSAALGRRKNAGETAGKDRLLVKPLTVELATDIAERFGFDHDSLLP